MRRLINYWSWGLCVIPICWLPYHVNKLTHITYLIMYLVAIIKKKKSNLSIFACFPVFSLVAHRCHDFWNKWSWGLCVIPIWWITYNGNKLTHITYLVMYMVAIIKQKKPNLSIFACLPVFSLVASRCHNFWNKWSWWLCVIPTGWLPYHVKKLTDITNLVMYLVTIMKKKIKFVDFCLLTSFFLSCT